MTRSVWSLARERNDDAKARRKPTCDLPNRRPKDQISQRLLSRDRIRRQRARRILRTQSRRTGRLPTGRIRHPRKSALRIRMATQRAIAALPQRRAPRAAHIVRCDTRSLQRCRSNAETYVTLRLTASAQSCRALPGLCLLALSLGEPRSVYGRAGGGRTGPCRWRQLYPIPQRPRNLRAGDKRRRQDQSRIPSVHLVAQRHDAATDHRREPDCVFRPTGSNRCCRARALPGQVGQGRTNSLACEMLDAWSIAAATT
jgi:hypothetical protein